jgi:hypothetical protein
MFFFVRSRGICGPVLAFATSCSIAHAGAFNEPAGHAQIILTNERSTANQYWLADGATRRPVFFAMHERSLLLQFGVTSQLMGILKVSRVSAAGTAGATYDSTGPIDIGAQWKLTTLDGYVVSTQALLHVPSRDMQTATWLFGETAREPEVRLLLGKTYHMGGKKGFIDMQAGYRMRSHGLGREWHFDLTTGVEITPTLTLLTQTFTTQASARPTNTYALFEQRKKQVSLVRDFGSFSLQFGVFHTTTGRRSYVERGTILSLWTRM